jgi:hypothetical protein
VVELAVVEVEPETAVEGDPGMGTVDVLVTTVVGDEAAGRSVHPAAPTSKKVTRLIRSSFLKGHDLLGWCFLEQGALSKLNASTGPRTLREDIPSA